MSTSPPPTSRKPRNPNVDYGQSHMGWVSLDDIRNVWTAEMREFDTVVWPDRTNGSRAHVLKFIDSLQFQLYQRAQSHFRSFLEALSPVEREKVEKQVAAGDARDQHKERLGRIRQGGG